MHRPTVTILALALAATTAAAALAGPAASDQGPGPRWFAGDWHVHTAASHDACDPRNATGWLDDPSDGCGDGPHTLSARGATRMLEAESRGLDYVRITDHNTMAGPRHAAEHYDGPVVLVPGYEHSLDGGHAGISTLDLLATGVFDSPPGTAAGFNSFMDTVHAEPGGLFVVNHPTDSKGDGWTRDGFDWDRVDALEVWNIHWLYRDEVFQGATTTSENDEALDLWTELLNAGHRIPIVGGSDNHWLATSAVQGIGQPTTWVHAPSSDAATVIESVREGRTYVSWDFLGPRVEFTSEDGNGNTLRPGDTVADGPVGFTARVDNSAGERVRFVSCEGLLAEFELTSPTETVSVATSLDAPCWVRVDVLDVDDELGPNHLLYRAITSPIYVTA